MKLFCDTTVQCTHNVLCQIQHNLCMTSLFQRKVLQRGCTINDKLFSLDDR